MDELFLPTLHSFVNNNVFTGSSGPLRFKATPVLTYLPNKEVDMEASSIKTEYWHGLICYEKSEMEGEREFPLSADGLTQMRKWLLENK